MCRQDGNGGRSSNTLIIDIERRISFYYSHYDSCKHHMAFLGSRDGQTFCRELESKYLRLCGSYTLLQ